MEIKPIRSPSVRIDGPPVISTIEPPVTQRAQRSVIPEIDMPIINMPDTTIKYPVIDVPTQEEFDAAVRAEREKQEEEKQEKTRGLPDTTPTPQLPPVVQTTQDNRVISDDAPKTNLGVPVIEVPIIGEVPIPPKEQVILAGTTATAPAQYTIDEYSVESDGNIVCEPNFVLNGASNINASLILPAAPSALDSNTYVAVRWSGILAQNCTSVK